jgi:uncharacterized protein YbbC (DUF1343 family)
MIEWEGYRDPRTGLLFRSLYGERRKPPIEWLQGIDCFVVDIPDVGARYYTFAWTAALCFEACAEIGVPFLVLDRPNPIGGTQVQGTMLDPAYRSFVGLHPVPMRHGWTLGELIGHVQRSRVPTADIQWVLAQGWDGVAYHDETGLLWAMPSPNMPSVDTAVVYPGMCLLEGTSLSEGRGTTRPFEIFGAPKIDGWALCDRLNGLGLGGVFFRPIQFQPTFHKHAGKICQGAFIHVTNRAVFDPTLTALAVLGEVLSLFPGSCQWNPPPYEYERKKLPFDILAGNSWLRESLERGASLRDLNERIRAERQHFLDAWSEAAFYTRPTGWPG